MPSFDTVSEVDWQEVRNAVDQAKREHQTRFDFRNVDSGFELQERAIIVHAEEDFQIDQLMQILRDKCARRKVDTKAIALGDVEAAGKIRRRTVTFLHGIDRESAKKVQKCVRDVNKKLQVQIQGEQVRVTGKKRDELQQAIAALRELDLPMPLQFTNYRD